MRIKEKARYLRKKQTESEAKLWEILRNRKLDGKKFLRQHPIKIKYLDKFNYFITDFYCAEKNLAIEIDGKIHENQKEYDDLRTRMINQNGINVIRIKNEEMNETRKVIDKIRGCLNSPPPPSL